MLIWAALLPPTARAQPVLPVGKSGRQPVGQPGRQPSELLPGLPPLAALAQGGQEPPGLIGCPLPTKPPVRSCRPSKLPLSKARASGRLRLRRPERPGTMPPQRCGSTSRDEPGHLRYEGPDGGGKPTARQGARRQPACAETRHHRPPRRPPPRWPAAWARPPGQRGTCGVLPWERRRVLATRNGWGGRRRGALTTRAEYGWR